MTRLSHLPGGRLMTHKPCGRLVLRVDAPDWGGITYLLPEPYPANVAVFNGYEQYPHGWSHVNSAVGYKYRGYPIHPVHVCPAYTPSERTSA